MSNHKVAFLLCVLAWCQVYERIFNSDIAGFVVGDATKLELPDNIDVTTAAQEYAEFRYIKHKAPAWLRKGGDS